MQITVLKDEREAPQLCSLQLPAGSSVAQALVASGWWQLGEPVPPLAIFGRPVQPATVLAEGDRIEWLRPLLADPKEQRRAKVQAARRARGSFR